MASKHERLAATLRYDISDGKYQPGDQLPGEFALMAQYGVSRTTVRTALTTLQNEGLVRSEPGLGSFVREIVHLQYRPQSDFRRPSTTPEADDFTQAKPESDVVLRQRIRVERVQAPDDVARRLGIPAGEVVVLRARDTFLDEEPYHLNDSYYPRDVVEGTSVMSREDIPDGVNRLLADHGYVQARAFDEIWCRMPRPEESTRLNLGPGVPVAEHVITGLTAEGRAIRMVRAIIPGDRNVITFDRTHPDTEGARC